MKKYLFLLLSVAGLVICTVGIARHAERSKVISTTQSQAIPIPDYVTYRMLFHHVQLMQEKSSDAEQRGDAVAARAYRRFLVSRAQLTDDQARALNYVASQCEQAVSQLDEEARAIIAERRKQYLATGTVPPRSNVLDALQNERNSRILNCRDQLRSSFGPSDWSRFEDFIQREVVSKITVNGSR